jgi:mgtE-like transporter
VTYYHFNRIIRESIGVLLLCSFIAVLAGQVLYSMQEKLVAIPIFLVFIPVLNGLGGNLGSIFGARISSALHLGSISSVTDVELLKNIYMSLFLGGSTFSCLAIIIYLVAPFLGIEITIDVMRFLAIFIFSGIILTVCVMCIALVAAFLSFRRGIDPDNTVIPLVTTVGDGLGIICLMSMILVIGI